MANDTVTIRCRYPNGIRLQLNGSTEIVEINGYLQKNSDGKAGYTPNVPKDFWLKWVSENKERDILTNGFISAVA